MTGTYRYCGLVLDSQLPLPELEAVSDVTASDIRVREFRAGSVPDDLACYGPNWAIGPSEAWWWLKDRACYRVTPGLIEVDGHHSEESLVRALLFEAPMLMAMIFKNIFCLHAASVALADETLVFCGAAASGRSTAAARLALQGGQIITDSLARIDVSGKAGPEIIPQAGGCLLWPHALDLLDLPPSLGQAVRQDVQLRRVPLKAVSCPQPVEYLYWREPYPTAHRLEDEPTETTEPRSTRRLFARLACITAGRLWIDPAGRSKAHFEWCLRLAQDCQMAPAPADYFDWSR